MAERQFSQTIGVRSLVQQLISDLPGGKWRLILAAILSVAASGAAVALIGLSAWLLSRAAEQPPVHYLMVAVVGVRFFGISRGVFRYFERLLGHDVALRMQTNLRLNVFARLARTTLLGARRGDLLARTISDVEAIMDIIVRVFLPFVSAGFVIFGTSLILAFFNLSSAIILLTCSLIAGVVLPWLTQHLDRSVAAVAVEQRAELAQVVHVTARAAVDIVAYGRTEAQLAAVAQADRRLRRAEAASAWTRGLAAGGQLVFMGLAVAAALVCGSQAVAAGTMPGRDLAVLALVPLALHEVFSDLTKAAQTLNRAGASLRRVIAILAAKPIGLGDRPLAKPETSQSLLRLTDLSIGWPGSPTLVEGLDLIVESGQAVAVTGPSGVGKTTLAATILGLIPARGGKLKATESLGYLEQEAHIFATTVEENVRIGNPKASDGEVAAALRQAGLSYLNPKSLVGEDGGSLSGGEVRRLALARLLVVDPRPTLLLLDEPTEHLDAVTAKQLMDDIWRACLPSGALLVLTHDAGVVARCDRQVSL